MPPRLKRTRGLPETFAGQWVEVGEYRRRASVTLDGSGNGTVQFDVRSSNQRYVIKYVTVSTNQAQTTAPYPTAIVYEGTTSAGLMDGATWTGNQDTFTGRFVIDAGTDLLVAFTGGIPGTIATAAIEGTNELVAGLVGQ